MSRLIQAAFNKSLLTNVVSGLLIVLSYYYVNNPMTATVLSNVGIFALSGALTNWIAIYMLFEKVPFIYGSGVIPVRFKEFKQGMRHLILQEFFQADGLKAVSLPSPSQENWQKLADSLNYEKIYEALVDGIMTSSFGKMVTMFGGNEAVEPLRKPLQEKIHQAISQMLQDEATQQQIMEKLKGTASDEQFYSTIEKIVDNRLDTLTPKMVKEIIQKMIREHLGWLVVWGGVFGGLIGLTASFI
jgi:uncharacterized membrane protein YheB (UPF0754 family)